MGRSERLNRDPKTVKQEALVQAIPQHNGITTDYNG